jgi:hypothetical protein
MAAAKRCSECPAKLTYPTGEPKPAGTLTCSVKCRSARARRLKREAAKRGGDKRSAHVQEVSDALKDGDALHEAAVDEFRPLVREAMTDDVLRGIDLLIKATPLALAALQADLTNSDDAIRQRAYTLLLKYTMGNPSVAPPSQQAAPAGLTVQFNLPRPGDDPAATSSTPATSRSCGPATTAARRSPTQSSWGVEPLRGLPRRHAGAAEGAVRRRLQWLSVSFEYRPLPRWRRSTPPRARHRLIVGGYGSGKSHALCAEAIALGFEHPGMEALVMRKTVPALKVTTERIFVSLLPPEFLEQCEVGKAGGHIDFIRFPNGTIVLVPRLRRLEEAPLDEPRVHLLGRGRRVHA